MYNHVPSALQGIGRKETEESKQLFTYIHACTLYIRVHVRVVLLHCVHVTCLYHAMYNVHVRCIYNYIHVPAVRGPCCVHVTPMTVSCALYHVHVIVVSWSTRKNIQHEGGTITCTVKSMRQLTCTDQISFSARI